MQDRQVTTPPTLSRAKTGDLLADPQEVPDQVRDSIVMPPCVVAEVR